MVTTADLAEAARSVQRQYWTHQLLGLQDGCRDIAECSQGVGSSFYYNLYIRFPSLQHLRLTRKLMNKECFLYMESCLGQGGYLANRKLFKIKRTFIPGVP